MFMLIPPATPPPRPPKVIHAVGGGGHPVALLGSRLIYFHSLPKQIMKKSKGPPFVTKYMGGNSWQLMNDPVLTQVKNRKYRVDGIEGDGDARVCS